MFRIPDLVNARDDSREAVQRILQTTLENLKSYLEGSPSNVVET